jgi:gliding motility-associated-like protein
MRKHYVPMLATLRLGLLLTLLLGAFAARSQTACPSPLPRGCPEPFRVVDVGTNLEVTTLLVGCPVRFVQNCGRATKPELLYYQVVPGSNATPSNCLPTTTAGVTTYTPTAADVGPVTVFELSNPDPSTGAGGSGVAYIRNYQVVAATSPTFTITACAGNTALITVTDRLYTQYTLRVNGGAEQPLVGRQPQLVAINPNVSNTFVLTGHLTNSTCGVSATQTATLAAAQTPVLTRLTRSGTAATGGPTLLEFSQVPTGYNYYLQVERPNLPGTYRRVATLAVAQGSSTTSFSLNPAAPGRYRLLRTDACLTPDSAASNPVITVGLSGTSTNNRVNLIFTPYAQAAVVSYTLTRSDGLVIPPLPSSATGYVDAAVVCGTTYTYRLTATLVGGGQSISNTVSVPTQSTLPPPAPLVVASFDVQNRVVVTASPGQGSAFAAGGQVVISRQAGGANPVPYPPLSTGKAGVASRTVRDSTALATLLSSPPCYSATLRDTCGNVSAPSASSCPALLSAAAADPQGLTAQLRWSAFQGPAGAGATYRVLTIAADGTVLATSAPTTGLTYFDPTPPIDVQVLRYRVEASGAGLPAGTVSYSNVASIVRRPRLTVPTAFSPNGDGLNDVLELKGRYLQNFTFIIVDRNGQQVFRSTDRTQTWDGTINGHAPVNGAYVWRLDLQGEDGQTVRQTGTVTILK